MDALRITRESSVRLVPDPRRVITKLFMPGDEVVRDGLSRPKPSCDGSWR